MIGLRRYLALAGFAVGAVGAALGRPSIVWVAIGLLSVAFVLRLAAGFRERRAASRSDQGGAADDK